jgi:hypothetical protein
MNAELDAAHDMEELAEDLYVKLLGLAKSSDLRRRFYEDIYHKRPTFFTIYQTPVMTGNKSVAIAMINHDILRRFSEACGKGCHASYMIDNRILNIYLEFNPSVIVAASDDEALLQRRLEKETSW